MHIDYIRSQRDAREQEEAERRERRQAHEAQANAHEGLRVEKPYGLTPAQVDTMRVLVNGYSQQQMADYLGITVSSVKERLTAIRRKMDCDSTFEAALRWVREVEYGDIPEAA